MKPRGKWVLAAIGLVVLIGAGSVLWMAQWARRIPLKPWMSDASMPTAWERLSPRILPTPTQAELEKCQTTFPHSGVPRLLKSNLLTQPQAPVIPLVAPLSGDYAEVGDWMTQGAAIFLEEMGSLGPRIEVHDNQARSQETLEIAQKLAKRPELLAMVGPFSSQMALLIAPLCNEEHLSIIAPGATDPRMESAGAYAFALTPSRDARIHALGEALQRKGCHQVLILQQDGAKVFYQVADLFTERSQVAIRRLSYPPDLKAGAEFPQQAFSQPFDCVLLAENRPGPAAHLIAFLRENGFHGPIACLVDPGSADLLTYGGRFTDGVLMGGFACLDSSPQLAGLRQIHEKLFKRPANVMSAITYLALREVWRARQASPEPTREGVCQELAALRTPLKIFGPDAAKATCFRIEKGQYLPDQ